MQIVQNAITQLTSERDKLDAAISALSHLDNVAGTIVDGAKPKRRRKGRMSAAGRKRISEAAKARWARIKKQKKVGA